MIMIGNSQYDRNNDSREIMPMHENVHEEKVFRETDKKIGQREQNCVAVDCEFMMTLRW